MVCNKRCVQGPVFRPANGVALPRVLGCAPPFPGAPLVRNRLRRQ